MHSPRHHPTLVAAILTAGAIGQQPNQPAPDPLSLVARAETLLGKKETEDAILVLWQAHDLLLTLPSNAVHDAAWLSTRHLLATHDPRETQRRAVFASVAKQQVELATQYRLKKWLEVAASRLAVADLFDRDAGAKERTALAAAKPKTPPPKEPPPRPAPKGPPSLLASDRAAFVSGDWREIDGGVEVAARAASPTASTEWVTTAAHGDHEVAIDFRGLEAQQEHDGALALGLAILPGTNSYSGVRVHFSYHPKVRQYGVQVVAIENQQHQEIASGWVTPPTVPDGWHRIAVRVSGANLQVLLDYQSVVECKTQEPLRGQIGLFTGLANVPTCGVQFRNLRVDPLPADEPSDEELRARAQAANLAAIQATVDEAKGLLEKKQPEAASLRLRDALARVADLPAGVLRSNLEQTIATMLDKADPLATKRQKVAQAAAAELLALAAEYDKAGMARAALAVIQRAVAFDPAGTADRLAQAEAAVQRWNTAMAAARAAELAPPADDGMVLREWFAKGRKLDSRAPGMTIVGPSARAAAIAPEGIAYWLPHPTAPAITQAQIHVHLTAPGAEAGLVFDAVDQTNHALALVTRRADGLTLSIHRHVAGKWTQLLHQHLALDAWRLDGWHAVSVTSNAAGATVKLGTLELKLERKFLGQATGLFGLCAANSGKAPVDIELRAFRAGP